MAFRKFADSEKLEPVKEETFLDKIRIAKEIRNAVIKAKKK